MKKLTIYLVLFFSFCLHGCGGSSSSEDTADTTTDSGNNMYLKAMDFSQ